MKNGEIKMMRTIVENDKNKFIASLKAGGVPVEEKDGEFNPHPDYDYSISYKNNNPFEIFFKWVKKVKKDVKPKEDKAK